MIIFLDFTCLERAARPRRLKSKKLQKGPALKELPEDEGRDEGYNQVDCFLAPCIAIFEYNWLEAGQAATEQNSGIRRPLYNNYWRIISNHGS